MNFRQIDLALDLARTLNYRRTAANMFISQPALTHQIKKLEEEIGVALFRRSSHSVSLTPAGVIFSREMQETVERAELFRSKIYCVLDKEHPLAGRKMINPKDLTGECLLLNDGNGPQALLRAQQHLCQTASPAVQLCSNADTAFLWIAAGRGIALIPGFCYDGSEQYAFIPYNWNETIPCSIAWYRDDHRPCLERFVEIARSTYEKIQRENGIL